MRSLFLKLREDLGSHEFVMNNSRSLVAFFCGGLRDFEVSVQPLLRC